MSSYVRLNLGSTLIPRDLWERAKLHGYNRNDIRQIIIQNGEDALVDSLDTTLYCQKCGLSGTEGNNTECEHIWKQT